MTYVKGIFCIGMLALLNTCLVEGERHLATARQGEYLDDSPAQGQMADSLAKADEIAFNTLMTTAINQRLIGPEDADARAAAHRFLPNTSRYSDHHVLIQPLGVRDAYWLLLYEFVQEGAEKTPMFLGSFRKTGQIVDLLEMKPVQFDGHMSINFLESDMLEIEYFDLNAEFDNSETDLKWAEAASPAEEPLPIFIPSLDRGINVGYNYYRLDSIGVFHPVALPVEDLLTDIREY